MQHIEDAVKLTSIEEIESEITQRNELRASMVGQLYTSIITDEIYTLNMRLSEIRRNYECLNIHQILSKFENGLELYNTNAVFSNCVKSLVNGGDVYKMLESVIVMNHELEKRYRELIESGVLRTEMVLTKERFDEISKQLSEKNQ